MTSVELEIVSYSTQTLVKIIGKKSKNGIKKANEDEVHFLAECTKSYDFGLRQPNGLAKRYHKSRRYDYISHQHI